MGKQSGEVFDISTEPFGRDREKEKAYRYRVTHRNNDNRRRQFFEDYDDAYEYLMKLRFTENLDPIDVDDYQPLDNFIMLVDHTTGAESSIGGKPLIRFGTRHNLESYKNMIGYNKIKVGRKQ